MNSLVLHFKKHLAMENSGETPTWCSKSSLFKACTSYFSGVSAGSITDNVSNGYENMVLHSRKCPGEAICDYRV